MRIPPQIPEIVIAETNGLKKIIWRAPHITGKETRGLKALVLRNGTPDMLAQVKDYFQRNCGATLN